MALLSLLRHPGWCETTDAVLKHATSHLSQGAQTFILIAWDISFQPVSPIYMVTTTTSKKHHNKHLSSAPYHKRKHFSLHFFNSQATGRKGGFCRISNWDLRCPAVTLTSARWFFLQALVFFYNWDYSSDLKAFQNKLTPACTRWFILDISLFCKYKYSFTLSGNA